MKVGQTVGTLWDSEVRGQPSEGVDRKRVTVVWRVLWGTRQGGRRWGHAGSGTGQRLDSGWKGEGLCVMSKRKGKIKEDSKSFGLKNWEAGVHFN